MEGGSNQDENTHLKSLLFTRCTAFGTLEQFARDHQLKSTQDHSSRLNAAQQRLKRGRWVTMVRFLDFRRHRT